MTQKIKRIYYLEFDTQILQTLLNSETIQVADVLSASSSSSKNQKKKFRGFYCSYYLYEKVTTFFDIWVYQRVSKKKYTNGFESGGNILGQSASKC